MRRAKIVCTLGPARRAAGIHELVDAGMDVARLNLSHGDYAEHEERLPGASAGRGRGAAARSPSSSTCRARRSGSAGSRAVRCSWRTATTFTITTEDVPGRRRPASRRRTTGLPDDARVGDLILIDDGKVVAARRPRSRAPTS